LFDGFGGEGFIFAEGRDFDGRSHGRKEGEHSRVKVPSVSVSKASVTVTDALSALADRGAMARSLPCLVKKAKDAPA